GIQLRSHERGSARRAGDRSIPRRAGGIGAAPGSRRRIGLSRRGRGVLWRRIGWSRLSGFALIALLLVLWQTASATRAISPFYFPSLRRVARGLFPSTLHRSSPWAVALSLLRGFGGWCNAIAVGVTMGVLAGYLRFVYQLIEPLVELLRPIPSPAIIPLAILLLGIGSTMKVAIVAWACVFPM